MVMMTYQLPEQITQITSTGEFNEFDLNYLKAQNVSSAKLDATVRHPQPWWRNDLYP